MCCWRPVCPQTGRSVIDALEAVSARRPLPRSITVDHGTEFTSTVLDEWAYRRGVALDFIRPGKPVENAFLESFNGRLRDECLNLHRFMGMAPATASRQLAPRLQSQASSWRARSSDAERVRRTQSATRHRSGPIPAISRLKTEATSVTPGL